MSAGTRLSVDIGGTFTDATLVDPGSGNVRITKVLTTRADPSEGFLAAVTALLELDEDRASISELLHATTIATNAIIEGKMARTGFVTTQGFRDLLEIGRQIRPSLYDPQFIKPRPLVPRHLCVGVRERVDASGRIAVPLDDEDVATAAQLFRREEVEAVAVCLLHSYANPIHEERVTELLGRALPGVFISPSYRVAREFREYYRASTTVMNAGLRPTVDRYLERIEARLERSRIDARLLVMQSSGGVVPAKAARERPVGMLESGPAAGVLAAAYFGGPFARGNVISFDMGGTTAKACLVEKGRPSITKEYEVGAGEDGGSGGSRGSGYPLRTPVIDLVEIGAGGGSIAWVDAGGVMRVGPRSAGADPGPACYGRGGTLPTVTDANLVLGRLNPASFLGGNMTLDTRRAEDAIERHCARPLGLGVVDTAHGILEIANAAMVSALRLVSVQRGYDPRDFALVGFGGAGPLHANRLAAELGSKTLVIPRNPGVLSAHGLLVSDLRRDFACTRIGLLDATDGDGLNTTFEGLEEEAKRTLRLEGFDYYYERKIEMRYVGQGYELALPVPATTLGASELAELSRAFHADHQRAYGFSVTTEPIEIVNLQLTVIQPSVKAEVHTLSEGAGAAALVGARRVYFAENGVFGDTPIYDRSKLGAGARLSGPSIVEEYDSTTVIHPGYKATVAGGGHLVISACAS